MLIKMDIPRVGISVFVIIFQTPSVEDLIFKLINQFRIKSNLDLTAQLGSQHYLSNPRLIYKEGITPELDTY